METMLALCLFALTFGADLVASNDCCVADQFYVEFAGTKTKSSVPRGKEMSFEPLSDQNHTRRIRFMGEAAIDHTGHRYAFNVSWRDYHQMSTGSMRVLKFVNESTSYVIKDSKCHKRKSCEWEPPLCVPDDAYLEETFFVGKNALQLNAWKMRIEKEGKCRGDVRFSTTQANCIPVFSSMIGKHKKNSLGEYVRFEVDGMFFNYTESFSPSSFIIPDICHNATIKFKDETVEFFDEWKIFQEGMVFF